jgi:isoquinoline 1-oxidoreductase beta subunit
MRIESLSRRDAIRTVGAGALLVLGVQLTGGSLLAAPPVDPLAKPPTPGPDVFSPSVFLAVDAAGVVTLIIPRVEMGQGIRTTFAMLMADEMAASLSRVVIRQADGDARYGDQDTDASRSIRLFFRPLAFAAATARQMLETAAAQVWRAGILDCRAVDHEVIHVPTGRVLQFGQLAKPASLLPVPVPEKVRLRDPSSRRYIGHTIPSVDLAAMLRGRALYGADVVVPGLKHASIERCPVYGGKLKSFDGKAALAVRGVEKVIEIPASPMPGGHLPLGGVAVIASNSWSAMEGRRKLQIEWDLGPNATHDSAIYKTELEAAVRKAGKVVRTAGNFETAFAGAATRLAGAEYYVPYHPHATMEPPAATAALENGKLAVVAATQNPQGARTVLAQYLDMKEADIIVRPTFLGNGFGRKSMHDFVCEAAWLAKALGHPVKLLWSREDDIRHGYYHPVSLQRLDGGLDKNGLPVAWRHRSAFPSLASTFRADQIVPDAAQVGQGLVDMPYAIANLRCEVAGVPAHVRLAPDRAALNIPHAFAVCSFIDEMAAAAGKDPANFLFTHLAGPRKIDFKALNVDYPNYGAPLDEYPVDVGRLQSVLQFAMDRSGWGDPVLPRQGRGIAIHRSFLSYAAAVVVVNVATDGQISIPRVDIVIDCGQVLNSDRVKALMEDAVMFGIGLTLYGSLTVKNGAVEQANFDTYRVARADATPEIRVHVSPNGQTPSGAGDPAIAVIAPAICNAIFNAVGKRIRTLPIDTNLLKDDGTPPPSLTARPRN